MFFFSKLDFQITIFHFTSCWFYHGYVLGNLYALHVMHMFWPCKFCDQIRGTSIIKDNILKISVSERIMYAEHVKHVCL